MLSSLSRVDECTLSFVRKISDLWRSGKASSLTDYARNTRVEPITVVDRSLMNYEGTLETLNTLTSLFAAYYLQAISISATVGNIEVNRHLERFNPNRNPGDNLIDGAGTLLALEEFALSLPGVLSMEAGAGRDAEETISRTGRDDVRDIGMISNLCVGKMFTVEIKDNNHTAQIPVSVRLIATDSAPENIVSILSAGSDLKSVSERFEGLSLGRLTFWRDIVMMQDLIESHQERAMKDNTGMYLAARKRASGNFWSGLFSMNPSVATASNIFVVSNVTAQKLEGTIAGKLKDFKTREKVFASMYMIFMVVIDTEYDRVTIYTRGIPESNSLSLGALKSVNKGTGPNVSEILSAYTLGRSPNL